jgi:hypothetical protein
MSMPRLVLQFGVVFFTVPSLLSAQPEPEKQARDAERNLSADQKRLVDDLVDMEARWEVRYLNPRNPTPPRPLAEIRRDVMNRILAMPADEAKGYWRDLPYTLKEGFRRLDPAHVTAEERKAAGRLPAAAKEDVAQLLRDPIDEALAARRKVLAHGPACRALVATQLAGLNPESPMRLRHLGLLAELDRQEARERIIRITDSALHKASQFEKARKKGPSTIAMLAARRLCHRGDPGDPYYHLCYYNFIHRNHDYSAGVGLEFGNGPGNCLHVNFYGGQDNRMDCLGAVDYDSVKKAPGPAVTAKWWKQGPTVTALLGHVYLLHLVDQRDGVDLTVKFKVLDRSPEEWIIIEWESIPQEK